MKQPVRGEFFLIPHHACGDKVGYGTRVCQFWERKYLGCQLHGDLIGYQYKFKINPTTDFAAVIVTVSADEGESEQTILGRLYEKIKPYGTKAELAS